MNGAPANPPAPTRRHWSAFTLGAHVCVALLVLGMVAWRAYVDLPSGVEWPWFMVTVPAAAAAALSLIEALASTRSQSARPRRRWYQFTLRGALVFVMLIALGLVAWRAYDEPCREERRAMALVESLGGHYTTAAGGPAWLMSLFGDGHFQRITLIDVADARPEDYLESIAGLPRLKSLIVGGEDFSDDHLARLGGLSSLRVLVLDSTDVSDDAIDALHTHRPDLSVHRSQRRDRARIAKRFGDGGAGNMDAEIVGLEPWQLVSEYFVILTEASAPPGVANGDQELAALRRLPTIRSLRLDNCSKWVFRPTKNVVTDAGLEDLTRLLPRLDTLGLPATLVTDAGLEHLTRLKNLHSLDLTDNPQLTDAALKHVGQLSKLTCLTLSGTSVGGAGLEHLGRLTNLKILNLRNTLVRGTGIEQLRGLTNLEILDLRNAPVSDEGLLQFKQLESVLLLDLSNTKVTGVGLRHLAQLPKLQRIDLENCPITDHALEAITSWANSPFLNLSGTKITDQGIRHLARNKSWRGLDLSLTRITNAALDSLAGMDKLEWLSLRGTATDDTGAARLERVKSLTILDCRGSGITAEGKARLKQALPRLSIR